jgi:hypothetical protein
MNSKEALKLSIQSTAEEIEKMIQAIKEAAAQGKTSVLFKRTSDGAIRYFQSEGYKVTFPGRGNFRNPRISW